MPPLLAVESLAVSFGRSRALDGVDFAVPRGSIVGVLGPNGAGKTTLLNAIAGLVRPSSGSITLRGARIDGRPPHEIAALGICLVPEGRGILPGLTVWDNLRLALEAEPTSIERVLARFPVLGERREQAAGTLSGGEQQMLALARAFGDRPELLLVDEPSLGLAPRLVAMVVETIRHLHAERGRTVVWVEQYAARVLELADLVYILGRGRVMWAGETTELRASKVLADTYLGGPAP